MTNKCGILTLYGLINKEFPEIIQNEMEKRNINGTKLCFRKNRDHSAWFDLAVFKNWSECLNPFAFYLLLQDYIPFFQSITFRRYRPFCMKLNLNSTIYNTFHKTQESIIFISSAIYFILTTRFTTYCKNLNFMSQSPMNHRNLGDFIVRQLNI